MTAALVGCGGGNEDAPVSAGDARGQVWDDAGCGGCHTLAVAGPTATHAPSLDQRIPEIEASGENVTEVVIERVRDGSTPFTGDMPAFGDELTAQEIADVAAFVIESAAS
jgi:mono/diheme cytochrome c family protein